MKKTFGKRIAVFMLAMIMVCGAALPAAAAEYEDMSVVAEEAYATPRVYYWPCKVNEITAIQSSLSSYIGITKTFKVDTMIYSGTGSGTIVLSLYNPDGTVRFQNYVMNVGDSATWKFTLPSSGTYILIVDNYSDSEVGVFPSWS